jgi:hypothetical protein
MYLPKTTTPKPTNGRLVLTLPSGGEQELFTNLPFPLLQKKRMELINYGEYKKEVLRIRYLQR